MNTELMREKLLMAQELLSDVYYVACSESRENLESQMSVADSCIIEALEELE